MNTSSEPVRAFVAKNLHAIADILGIQQANVLAKNVEEQRELGIWRGKSRKED